MSRKLRTPLLVVAVLVLLVEVVVAVVEGGERDDGGFIPFRVRKRHCARENRRFNMS